MASPDEALVTAVKAVSPVASLVGSRVYHEERPQKTALPAITWVRTGIAREMLLDGPSGIATAFYELDVLSATTAEARTLADAIGVALNGVTGNFGGATVRLVSVTNETDFSDIDGDLKIRHVLIDVEIIFPE